MNTMGERIYALRKQNNMSQGDLADRLEVSRQTVSKWENDSSLPELDKIIRLCELFKVSSDYVLRGITEDAESKEKEQTVIKEKTVIIERHTDIKAVFSTGLIINALFFLFISPKSFYIPLLFGAVAAVLLLCKKHPVYFSLWLVYVYINVFCSLTTAGGIDLIFDKSAYTAEYAPLLAVSVLLWITLFALVGWGIRILNNKRKGD
ncbi:MAG: helix-turn-helix transcriptional regulator [Ruminococcaceae bacterium]|nr:helix-turn-helix transcriptional regulator [Oscillospiraceae bacterium]